MAAAPRTALPMAREPQPRRNARLPFQLIVYEIRSRSAGSVLGVAWAVVQPLLFLGTYWFLLTVLRSKRLGQGDDASQLAVLLSGLVAWQFIARSIGSSLGTLTTHANLIRNVNFPLGVLPFVTVGARAVDYVIGLVVVIALSVYAGHATLSFALLVPVTLVLLVFLISVAAILGPLAVMLRDLNRLMQISLRAGLFLTPVLYLP